MLFIQNAINDYTSSLSGSGRSFYQKMLDNEKYYDGENVSINKYEKIIYDMQGLSHKDMWTANHKIASQFFGFSIDQEASYLLGNGVNFKDDKTKEKLGNNFDEAISELFVKMRIHGASYGFWDIDHIVPFSRTEFIPFKDERNGKLKAGIRFYQIDLKKPRYITLYLPSGFIEYQEKNSVITEISKFRAYKLNLSTTAFYGTEIIGSENYSSFPIKEMKINNKCYSAMHGKRNTIDAYDIITSGMVNNTDEGSLIYWVLTNCGGMDEDDNEKFLANIHKSHVVHADGDAGASAVPHTIEAPVAANDTTLKQLTTQLYSDFQAFNPNAITAGNQTATAIRAMYIPLDMKCDKLEAAVTDFINEILEIAGIEDKPTYTRNKLLNVQEEVQTYIMSEAYTGFEYTQEKILTVYGDIDKLDEIRKKIDAESMQNLTEDSEGKNDGAAG